MPLLPCPQLRVFHQHPQGVVSVKFTTQVGRGAGLDAAARVSGAASRRDTVQRCRAPPRRPASPHQPLVHDHPHPPPAASVPCLPHEAADECVRVMNGRFFGGRQLEAAKWDGYTNFNVKVGVAGVLFVAAVVLGRVGPCLD